MSDQYLVEADGLHKRYPMADGAVEALGGVDLHIERGAFVAIMGASGSGKSTLLHLLAGLDRPDAGRVRVAGQDLGSLDDTATTIFRRRKIGVVFQAFNLLGMLSARENVALPLLLDGVPRSTALQRADAALGEVGLGGRAAHLPAQLSGGEQQRVAVARAVVTDADLILADEPTGNLDSVAAGHLSDLLRGLHARGRTILVITHEPKLACLAQRIGVLADGRLRGWLDGGDAAQVATAYLALAGAPA